jgi:hypothetical protein
MLIASRTLKLRQPDGEVDVPVSLFAPARDETRGWGCRFEIGWPDETKSMVARGSDSVQALEIALRLIGTQLYTSVHHGAGTLVFEKPGGGYGFPLPGNLRDMLAGDDAAFF